MTDKSPMTDKFVDHRQEILIPAAFGIHSKIQEELRDAISRLFGHSTFFFHEVFLRRPVIWYQELGGQWEKNAAYGTTQPFLSRFVHQSGLTPAINLPKVKQIADVLEPLYKWSGEIRSSDLPFDPLAVPLVATAVDSYHKDLDKLTFSLEHSIFLRGLLQIWLTVEQGKTYYPENWKGINDWERVFLDDFPFPRAEATVPGSNCDVSVIGRLRKDKIKEIYRESFAQKIQDALEARCSGKGGEEKDRVAALALLREYHVTLRPWLDDHATPIVIAVSISSDALFWGECVLILPGPEDTDLTPVGQAKTPAAMQKEHELLRKYQSLSTLIANNVKSIFMPIMTIFENYTLEYRLKNTWEVLNKKKRDAKITTPLSSTTPALLGLDRNWGMQQTEALERIGMGEKPPSVPVSGLASDHNSDDHADDGHAFIWILHTCMQNGQLWDKLNEIERSLINLWAARLALIFGALPPGIDIQQRMNELEESLVFVKYLVASPAILKAIISATAIKHGHGERTKKDASIKTALVVGGPGSGKDSMAKLVRLFSPGYRFGKCCTLNMASFRPKEAAVPLLLGLDVDIRSDSKFGQTTEEAINAAAPARYNLGGVSIRSLLGRAWMEQKDKAMSGPGGLTFILDELNSLDLDTQGALLRFLESGELLPLGEYQNPTSDVDALVVGVMNEDPYTITKVRTLDRIIKDKQVFGGMLGDFLYEFFRGQRRLRDDLYFRMARGGEIILPELRQRREDIPILFYFIIKKELMPSLGEQPEYAFEIELSTYESLMNPSLQWEGNIRELQALSREIFNIAVEDHKGQRRRYSASAGTRNGSDDGDTARTIRFRGAHVRRAQENLQRKVQPLAETLVHPT